MSEVQSRRMLLFWCVDMSRMDTSNGVGLHFVPAPLRLSFPTGLGDCIDQIPSYERGGSYV